MYSAKYGGRSGRSKGKQAVSKKKKHQKCSLCQEKGHDAEDCPRVKTNSRNSGGAGSGRSHKSSRKAGDGKQDDGSSEKNGLLPPGFFTTVDELVSDIRANTTSEDKQLPPPVLFDAGCDVGEALDQIASTNKKKSATVTYRNAAAAVPYAGCLCRQLLKPGKAWKPNAQRNAYMKEADPHTFFVLGLGNGFLHGSGDDDDSEDEGDADEVEEAISALLDAMDVDDTIVGVFVKLDYSSDYLERPGCDRAAQLRRFRATCNAALDANIPIQCRVEPGPTDEKTAIAEESGDDDNAKDADPYKLVMRDLATVLLEMSPEDASASLKIHLVCWNGNSTHLLKLLGAFPENLYVGMNASVGFTKATRAHECAFEVPLNRLLLETDAPNAIPAPVTIATGRSAFCHSGLVPFVAAAVAEHKSNLGVTALDVARAAADNVVTLYGEGIGARVEEAGFELAEMIETARKEQEELEEREAAAAKEEGEQQANNEEFESKQEKKKKKKKKGKGGGQGSGDQESNGADVEADFDEGVLAAMVDEN